MKLDKDQILAFKRRVRAKLRATRERDVPPADQMVSGDISWPRLAIYVIPLLYEVPIAHNSAFTHFHDDNPISELKGVPLKTARDQPDIPIQLLQRGNRFVSLRFWQLEGTSRRELNEEFSNCASQVLRAISGIPPLDVGQATSHGGGRITTVEAVTPVSAEGELGLASAMQDPLSRCLSVLMQQIRAFRIAQNVRIPELTYERIFPVIPWIWRSLSKPYRFGEPGLRILAHLNVETRTRRTTDQDAISRQQQIVGRIVKRDPLILYQERRLAAEVSLYREGEYAEAAINSAIAAEVLLSSTLGLLYWEESGGCEPTPESEATRALSLDLARRVRTYFHPRLGGDWRLRGGTAVAQWYENVAGLRNQVVHRGYRPQKGEAIESHNSLISLEKFICDRLAENSGKYPMSALIIVGSPGLRSRGKWSNGRFATERIGDFMLKIDEYVAWRDSVDDLIRAMR